MITVLFIGQEVKCWEGLNKVVIVIVNNIVMCT